MVRKNYTILMLQWGRSLGAPESGLNSGTYLNCFSSFNGAGAWELRKVKLSGGSAGLQNCFNGAGAWELRKAFASQVT